MNRWHSYSQDPNAPEVIKLRKEAIANIRTGRLIKSRVQYLCELAAGKAVLDIGVVNHTTSAADSPEWLHANLKRRAARCLGVDVLELEIANLRKRGFDVLCADVTREPLPMKFDLIIAGEVLEHLDAPGMFMKHCSAMLVPGGRLAITVPNPWYANVILANLLEHSCFSDSADHVAWYEPWTLYELAQRYNLELVSVAGIRETYAKGWKGKVFFAGRPLLVHLGLSTQLFAKSSLYEFIRT
jgi:2-polyprenyl-3-methyl-5-hydroxy-6-metoxy-1,4-benzoquinol methylase